MMAVLRCCSFNCRGWNSGLATLNHHIDCLDLRFIQEHWLFKEHLHKLTDSSPDFSSVSVSGMDSVSLLSGRPFGGCSILFRNSLSPFITPLVTCSDRFCAIRICDSSGLKFLLISVYMPTEYRLSFFSEYLNTLGELEGFITSQQCDVNFVVGDFIVDFDWGGSLAKMLLNLLACDLFFRSSIKYTYERDDGLSRSWLDNIICSQAFSSLVSEVFTICSGCSLSDHFTVRFLLHVNCSPLSCSSSPSSSTSLHIDWSKATSLDIDNFQAQIADCLFAFPPDTASCAKPSCSSHHKFLDDYAQYVISYLDSCAFQCLPTYKASSRKVVGWNENASRLKDATNFWHRVWEQAGCPSAGVSFNIKRCAKRQYIYEV